MIGTNDMRQYLKKIIFNNELMDRLLVSRGCRQLEAAYEKRRAYYYDIARKRGIVYDEGRVQSAVRERLAERGHLVRKKQLGDVHTFAFISRRRWHNHLYDDLKRLGPVSEFDYEGRGYSWGEFARGNREDLARRKEMTDSAFQVILETHKRMPIDWIFFYVSEIDISPELVKRIEQEIGVPTVNMSLDDKQCWVRPRKKKGQLGQVDLASVFDLSWTSARVACEWYLCEGGRPIYMPGGCNPRAYQPSALVQDIPVSFIGDAYGFRPGVVRWLKQNDIPIQVYGRGWNTQEIWGDEAVKVFNRSRINLGMGGIGYSEALTNVKIRDFEVPCGGGGLYVTSFNPDLAFHFDIGREIVCYSNRHEMVEMLHYYLSHPDEAILIAARGRRRCLNEHCWLNRYVKICQMLGILDDLKDEKILAKEYLGE